MTAIAGVAFASGDPGATETAKLATILATTVATMLEAMGSRGSDRATHCQSPDGAPISGPAAALGAASHDWEEGPALAQRGPVAIAADATLYHRDDLRRTLAVGNAALDTTSLLLAAYEMFGEGCAAHLEGDFAFVIWDATRRRLVAARDFTGKRPLHFAADRDTIRCASTVAGLLADRSIQRRMDLTTVATVAAGLWTHSRATAWEGIEELPAGHTLVWEPGSTPRMHLHWSPPTRIVQRGSSPDDAAQELRALLVRAVDERMAPRAPTAISLSGGWDSTAVYASGKLALRARTRTAGELRPISISYPPGDPGREDELIDAVVGHWGDTTDLIDVDSLAIFPTGPDAERERDEPFAHPYEGWNRGLHRRARRAGARVMLDGVGGDQLFQVSDIFLADLFRTGRWIELARQWRSRSAGRPDIRELWRWGIRPALPGPLVRALARVRGLEPPAHYLERTPPPWFRLRTLAELGVLERERASRIALPASSGVLAETHAFLRFPFFQRIMARLHGFALSEGIELRSPLMDTRVVRFAAERPWSERVDGKETKLLLRRAMRGHLPDAVLAPRARRTGITSAYLIRQLRTTGRPHFEALLRDSRLVDLRIVDADRLRRAWELLAQHDDDELGGRLYFTLQADRWLRAQEST